MAIIKRVFLFVLLPLLTILIVNLTSFLVVRNSGLIFPAILIILVGLALVLLIIKKLTGLTSVLLIMGSILGLIHPIGMLDGPKLPSFSRIFSIIFILIFIVLLAMTTSFGIVIFAGLISLLKLQFIKDYNLLLVGLVVGFLFQFTIRKRFLQNMTWKRISDIWTKLPTISGVTVGGFLFVGSNEALQNQLIQHSLNSEFTNTQLFVWLYIGSLFFLLVSWIFERIGKTMAPNDDTREPIDIFYAVFFSSFIANVLLFTLLFDSILITLYSHAQMGGQIP